MDLVVSVRPDSHVFLDRVRSRTAPRYEVNIVWYCGDTLVSSVLQLLFCLFRAYRIHGIPCIEEYVGSGLLLQVADSDVLPVTRHNKLEKKHDI